MSYGLSLLVIAVMDVNYCMNIDYKITYNCLSVVLRDDIRKTQMCLSTLQDEMS